MPFDNIAAFLKAQVKNIAIRYRQKSRLLQGFRFDAVTVAQCANCCRRTETLSVCRKTIPKENAALTATKLNGAQQFGKYWATTRYQYDYSS